LVRTGVKKEGYLILRKETGKGCRERESVEKDTRKKGGGRELESVCMKGIWELNQETRQTHRALENQSTSLGPKKREPGLREKRLGKRKGRNKQRRKEERERQIEGRTVN